MLSGNESDVESGIDLYVVPPVEFVHVFESDGTKKVLVVCPDPCGRSDCE
jgi:hypothetical protein